MKPALQRLPSRDEVAKVLRALYNLPSDLELGIDYEALEAQALAAQVDGYPSLQAIENEPRREVRFAMYCDRVISLFGRWHSFEALLAFTSGVIAADEPTLTYVDSLVCITASTRTKAMRVVKLENKNPVLCRASNGDMYRLHDEYRDIVAHVHGLARGETIRNV